MKLLICVKEARKTLRLDGMCEIKIEGVRRVDHVEELSISWEVVSRGYGNES